MRYTATIVVFLLLGFTNCNPATANSLVAFDAAGRAIGYYQGNCDSSGDVWKVYSLSGYAACILVSTGMLDTTIPNGEYGLYESAFDGANCTGNRFAYTNTDQVPFYDGFVLGSQHDLAAYTVNDGTVSLLIGLLSNSVPIGGVCMSLTGGSNVPRQFYAVPAFDNDPMVTGFSNVSYRGPLRLQPASDSALSDIIFFDGLE